MVGHVVLVGELGRAYRTEVGIPLRKRHVEDPGVDGRIILKLIKENVFKWFNMG
jgi:hypothetical protein